MKCYLRRSGRGGGGEGKIQTEREMVTNWLNAGSLFPVYNLLIITLYL